MSMDDDKDNDELEEDKAESFDESESKEEDGSDDDDVFDESDWDKFRRDTEAELLLWNGIIVEDVLEVVLWVAEVPDAAVLDEFWDGWQVVKDAVDRIGNCDVIRRPKKDLLLIMLSLGIRR